MMKRVIVNTHIYVVIHTVIKWFKRETLQIHHPYLTSEKKTVITACTACNFIQRTVMLKTHNPFSSLVNASILGVCWERTGDV